MSAEALIAAIRRGDGEAVEVLLQADASLAFARTGGASVLLLAQYHRKPRIVAAIRRRRDGLDLFEAAALGDLACVAAHLDTHPARANAVAEDGFGPLGLAAFFGQEATAALLIERGARVDTPQANAMQVMPLHSAAAARSVSIARMLLEAGAPVDARQGTGPRGFTPLMEAAYNGQGEMILLLLRHGADPTLRDGEGLSAADHARKPGHTALAGMLDQPA